MPLMDRPRWNSGFEVDKASLNPPLNEVFLSWLSRSVTIVTSDIHGLDAGGGIR